MITEKLAQKPVITISRNAGVDEAAKLMRDAHVGDLVVVELEEQGEIPVSILTDRDIVVSTIALGIDPRTLRVEDIMSTELVTAKSGDTMAHVIGLMREHGYRRIPIVNREGALEGIVSADDVVAVLAAELTSVATLPRQQKSTETQKRRKFA